MDLITFIVSNKFSFANLFIIYYELIRKCLISIFCYFLYDWAGCPYSCDFAFPFVVFGTIHQNFCSLHS